MKLYRDTSVEGLLLARKEAAQLQESLVHILHERKKIASQLGKDSENSDLRKLALDLRNEHARISEQCTTLNKHIELGIDSVPNLITPKIAAITTPQVTECFGPPARPQDKSLCHKEIGERLGIIDFKAASSVSGSASYYLLDDGALLEQALVQYAIALCRQEGFHIATPPSMVKSEFGIACGFRPREIETGKHYVYHIEMPPRSPALTLAGTAEIPLAGFMAQKVMPDSYFKERGQFRLVGTNRAFRPETGRSGHNARGLFRVHEFTKVEMAAWTKPDLEASSACLRDLVDIQKRIIEGLEIPARVVQIPPTDLGASAYEKFDIEAWMPGRGEWGEVTSASNCTDYQSRRLHTLERSMRHVHTLNATAMAVPRIIIALIENNYDPETNTVALPTALHKLMGCTHLKPREW